MWVAKKKEYQQFGHTLDDSKYFRRRRPHISLCGIELDPMSIHGPELTRCTTCADRWNAENPHRSPAGRPAGKLARHHCPGCEDEHIIRPARADP